MSRKRKSESKKEEELSIKRRKLSVPLFFRTQNQECKIIWTDGPVEFDSDIQIEDFLCDNSKIIQTFEHGDLILPKLGMGAYRSTSSYLVVNENLVSEKERVMFKFKPNETTNLAVVPIGDSSGYGLIPRRYSKYIQDPISFWHKALWNHKESSSCHLVPGYTGIWEIQMDALAHTSVLLENSVLHRNCNVRWNAGTVEIESPESTDIPYGKQWVKLDGKTPQIYLTEPLALLEVDPIMEDTRRKNLNEMELLEDDLLYGTVKKGDFLSIKTVPKEPNKENGFGGSGVTFVGIDYHSKDIVAQRRSWYIDQLTEKSVDYTNTLFFKSKVATQKGPFGKIPLYTSQIEGEEWYIAQV